MLLEMLRCKSNESFTDFLLTRHNRFLLLRIMYIISETIVICREKVPDDFLFIWMILLLHYAFHHGIAVHECIQPLMIKGIEMIGLERKSFLKAYRKVQGICESLCRYHPEPLEIIACLDGFNDLAG